MAGDIREEVREMVGAWRDVRDVVKKSKPGGINPAERAEIKFQVMEAILETLDVINVGAERAKRIKEVLEENL